MAPTRSVPSPRETPLKSAHRRSLAAAPGDSGVPRARGRTSRRTKAESVRCVRYEMSPMSRAAQCSLAIERLLDCDVGHGGGWRSPVPVPQPRRKPHDIAGADILDWTAIALNPSEAGGDDQGLWRLENYAAAFSMGEYGRPRLSATAL